MSLTKLPLGRNNSVMTSIFPPRESLVVTSRLGTGNSRTFFLRCMYQESCGGSVMALSEKAGWLWQIGHVLRIWCLSESECWLIDNRENWQCWEKWMANWERWVNKWEKLVAYWERWVANWERWVANWERWVANWERWVANWEGWWLTERDGWLTERDGWLSERDGWLTERWLTERDGVAKWQRCVAKSSTVTRNSFILYFHCRKSSIVTRNSFILYFQCRSSTVTRNSFILYFHCRKSSTVTMKNSLTQWPSSHPLIRVESVAQWYSGWLMSCRS